MAYTDNIIGVKYSTVKQTRKLSELLLAKISDAAGDATNAIKYASISGSTISFWTDAAHTGAADYTIDLPTEFFLDQTKTAFVQNFVFSAQTYPGASNPNLDGKPIMVMAVKGLAADGTETTTYSFVDLAVLSDTGKADKVSGATDGNLAALDANGNLTDSGKAASDFCLISNVATDAEFDEMLTDIGLLTASAGA